MICVLSDAGGTEHEAPSMIVLVGDLRTRSGRGERPLLALEQGYYMKHTSRGRTSATILAFTAMLFAPALAAAQMAPAPSPSPAPMGDGQMEGGMNMPDKMPAKKPGCCGMGGMAAKPAPMPMKAKPHSHRAKTKPTAAKPAPKAPMAKPMSDHM